jgi:hypothetical protein
MAGILTPLHPARLLRAARDRYRRARAVGAERGFGTVEWVLIAFFVAGMAIALGVVLYNAVADKGAEVSNCIQGSSGCAG